MHRLFIAFDLPDWLTDPLFAIMEGVAGANWQRADQLHLTLRYIGKADSRTCDDVVSALSTLEFPEIGAQLSGVGSFDAKRNGGALWAGVSPQDALATLHRKLDQAMIRIGLPAEARAYLPHITVARLPRTHGITTDWLAHHAGLTSPVVRFTTLTLFDSLRGQHGSHYEPLARWRCAGQ